MKPDITDEEMNEALSCGYGLLKGCKLIPESEEDYLKRIKSQDTSLIKILNEVNMMTIYGEINGSAQQFGGECPEGYVLMKNGARPEDGGEYKANIDGEWTTILNTFEKAKANKIIEINNIRNEKEQSGVEYLGVIFDSDSVSEKRLTVAANTALIAIQNNQEFTIDWTLQDNSTITLNAEQMIGILPALANNSDVLHQKAKEIKEKIKLANTLKKLNSINWE